MTHEDSKGGLIVIGFGSMASAIVEGALRAGLLSPAQVAAANPGEGGRARAERLGCRAFSRSAEALRAFPGARVLLGVKPQKLGEAASAAEGLAADRCVVSVLAGATSASISAAFGSSRVVRVMPNTPAKVGRGITAIANDTSATEDDAAFAHELFSSVGEVVAMPESMLDAFTGVCGSGPAYVFYLAEAMIRGAREVGFNESDADRLVRATIIGAAALLDEDRAHDPGELRARVTSKNGTTAAATETLNDAGVMEAVARAVVAARDRGRELARQ
jgi:pyrroline-5-carboxylate reductase